MHRQRAVALAIAFMALVAPAAAKPLLDMPGLFAPKAPPPSLTFVYRGWRIDAARAARAQPPAKTVRAVQAQVDIVERLRLPPPVLDFMRAEPVIVDSGADPADEAADYVPGLGVVLHARRLDAKKPVLLYALLKAYLAQRLPGGAANPEVTGLRNLALARRVWPMTARMLRGNDEFFALTGAAYLYGTITREPYTRANLKKTEPQCYLWFARLFDAGRGRS